MDAQSPAADSGQPARIDAGQADWAEVRRWRKAKRAELIAARVAAGPQRRAGWDAAITARIVDGVPDLERLTVGMSITSQLDRRS